MELKNAVPLLNQGMTAVIIAQFFSIFGENAILFAALALLKNLYYPDWSKPALQMCFVGAYLLTSVFTGQIADSFPKGRVMVVANGLKVLGALMIFWGGNPFIGYAIVGLGAASYSPAKYGILSELSSGSDLVKANSLLEVATITAILLGSVASGYIADLDIKASIGMCCIVFFFAMVATFYIPKLKPANPNCNWKIAYMLDKFMCAFQTIWHNPAARFTLLGTCLFWGAGIVLRFILIDWVPVALGVNNNTMPTILNAIVAIGIVIGAALASKFITTRTLGRAIPAGILMGIFVALFMLQKDMLFAYIILIMMGCFGGLFLIPLNAYLQKFGQDHMGAGNAIAVQNMGENGTMLCMLGLYSASDVLGFPLFWVGIVFGVLLSSIILFFWLIWLSKKKKVYNNNTS